MKELIESKRLIQRKLTQKDASFILTLMNDPDYHRFIGDRGLRTVPDTEKYLEEKYIQSYKTSGFALYLVLLKETKEPIGICGLIKRDSLETVDLGFAFSKEHRNKGYGTESCLEWLKEAKSLAFNYILAITSKDNTNSIALLNKLNFFYEKDFKLPDETEILNQYRVNL